LFHSTSTSQAPGAGLQYTVSLSSGEIASRAFFMPVKNVVLVNIMFHFPQDNPGRTTRAGFGDLWAPDDPNTTPANLARITNRYNFVNDFYPRIKAIWQQAGIDFQCYADGTLETIGSDSTGSFNTGDGTSWSTPTLNLASSYGPNGSPYIHVYLVRTVNAGDDDGMTAPSQVGSGYSTSVFLSDADTTGAVLAHELGHSMTLHDDNVPSDIVGFINNFRRSSPDPVSLMLMKGVGASGNAVTDVEGSIAGRMARKRGFAPQQ
jgi:hypothetical protein